MSYICQNCGKGITYGRTQRHRRGVAGKRWAKRAQSTLRTFRPNLQKIAVVVGNTKVQMLLCTKCIKRFNKEEKLA